MEKKKIQRADEIAENAVGGFGSFMGVLGTVILICIVTGLIFMCIFAFYVKTCIMPGVELDLDDFTLKQSSTIWYQDSYGTWKELYTLSGSENRIWVDYDQIPEYMSDALVAIEDKRFYKHNGVDWFRTGHAVLNMFTGGSIIGGSTITQQLIKNITHQDDVTVQRKLLEIFQAISFDSKYEKWEILEWYLNAVYFGEGCYGVQTAAETYFGKDVSELSLAECAAIVGITNLPTYYDPFYSVEQNKERQENVLWCMYDQGYITREEYEEAKAEELEFVRSENEPAKRVVRSYYVETIIDDVIKDLAEAKGINEATAEQLLYNAGYQIYSCIDVDMQNIVDKYYTDLEKLPQSKRNSSQQYQSAIVIVDQYTGEIKALCGGTGEKTINAGLNRATDSTRAPGSSIKPLAVYGPAVEYGLITPSTLVLDADGDTIKLNHAPKGWYPRNTPNTYDNVITILSALQSSKNTVSAQIMDKLLPETSLNYLRNNLGFVSFVDEDADFAPLALGAPKNGVTVREMAQAYTALANDGTFTYARTYNTIKDTNGKVVLDNQPETIDAFSSKTARVMTYMLNNAATYGTGYESKLTDMPVAGKTGTTSDNWDRWFCGYTPYYTCAVWVGYDTPEPLSFRGNVATQIWQMIMEDIHKDLSHKDFVISKGGGATGIFGSRSELEELVKAKEEEKEKDGEKKSDSGKTDSGSKSDSGTKSDTGKKSD